MDVTKFLIQFAYWIISISPWTLFYDTWHRLKIHTLSSRALPWFCTSFKSRRDTMLCFLFSKNPARLLVRNLSLFAFDGWDMCIQFVVNGYLKNGLWWDASYVCVSVFVCMFKWTPFLRKESEVWYDRAIIILILRPYSMFDRTVHLIETLFT